MKKEETKENSVPLFRRPQGVWMILALYAAVAFPPVGLALAAVYIPQDDPGHKRIGWLALVAALLSLAVRGAFLVNEAGGDLVEPYY